MQTNTALKLKPLLHAMDSWADDVRKRMFPVPASRVLLEDGTPINVPEYSYDLGVITSGACATPDAQAYFDEYVAGKPPSFDDVDGAV